MKLTSILRRQHGGEFFIKHWKVQGKRLLRDTGALKSLREKGIDFVDAKEYVMPSPIKQDLSVYFKPNTLSKPEPQKCLTLRDENVLLEGLDQAEVLTNTVQAQPDCLPDVARSEMKLPPDTDDLFISCIKSSLLYDPEQKKLPIRKDPLRPAWKFPRDYGITDKRRNYLLTLRMLELCYKLTKPKPILQDAKFTCTISHRDTLPINLSLRADALVMSENEVPLLAKSSPGVLRDISPLLPTISLVPSFILKDEHPLMGEAKFRNINFALVHFNGTEVSNIYETEVTENQFLGRSLMKCYTFAVSQARYLYGSDVIEPPKPVVIRCLHTDSHRFHYSIFQLNTLKTDGKLHNYYWSEPIQHLYSECSYVDGKPVLNDYNPEVFKRFISYYL